MTVEGIDHEGSAVFFTHESGSDVEIQTGDLLPPRTLRHMRNLKDWQMMAPILRKSKIIYYFCFQDDQIETKKRVKACIVISYSDLHRLPPEKQFA